MVADEPDFKKYPETIAEFAGIVAKHISRGLLEGAVRLIDGLRHVPGSHCVQRAVRGWEGRVWEVGDGEVDGPVSPRSRQAEWELARHPAFVGLVTERLTAEVQEATGRDDVVVRFNDDPFLEVRPD
jgi:hypothetical protein